MGTFVEQATGTVIGNDTRSRWKTGAMIILITIIVSGQGIYLMQQAALEGRLAVKKEPRQTHFERELQQLVRELEAREVVLNHDVHHLFVHGYDAKIQTLIKNGARHAVQLPAARFQELLEGLKKLQCALPVSEERARALDTLRELLEPVSLAREARG